MPTTVRIEFVPHEGTTLSPQVTYVDTDKIEMDDFGFPTCRLSDVLPLTAPTISPVKSKHLSPYRMS